MIFRTTDGELHHVSDQLWYWELFGPNPPQDYISNGCTMSPDSFRGYDHTVACHWHDWHYSPRSGIPRNRQGRESADYCFQENMKIVLRDAGMGRLRSWARAQLYYRTVRHLGSVAFYDGRPPADDLPPVREFAGVFKLLKRIF